MKKPIRACDVVLEKVQYPVLASPKLDGVRCTIQNGVAYSRQMKPLPQPRLQYLASSCEGYFNGLDGEIVVGEHDDKVFSRSTSFCMTASQREESFTFNCFDYMLDDKPFSERIKLVESRLRGLESEGVLVIPHRVVSNEADLLLFETECLSKGYEGIILRSMNGKYKSGKATVKEGYYLRLKRFMDDEAEIIGVEERMHNANEATTNELGRTARSSHQTGMIPAGDLGSFIVRNKEGVVFNVGSGLSAEDRVHFWEIREALSQGGTYIKYKYFPQGVKDKPRFPTFLGVRNRMDFD